MFRFPTVAKKFLARVAKNYRESALQQYQFGYVLAMSQFSIVRNCITFKQPSRTIQRQLPFQTVEKLY